MLEQFGGPLLAAALVLAAIRRQKPAGPVVRIGGAYAVVLLYVVYTSPRDPLTGAVVPNDTLSLLTAAGVGMGFLLNVFQRG